MGTPGDKRKYGKVVLDDPSSTLLDPDAEEQQKPPETPPPPPPPPHLLDLPPAEHQPSTSATATTEMGVYRGSALPQFESFTAYISPQTSAGLGNVPSPATEKIEQLPFAGTSLGQATIEDYFVQSKYYPSLTETTVQSSLSTAQKQPPQQTKTFPTLLLDEPGPSGLQQQQQRTKPAKLKKGKKQQQKTFECPICQKTFSNAARLAKHQQIHGGTSPYKCEHCKKSFSSRFKLVRHALIHSDRKPFSCQVCERTFHRKDHLKNHIKVHSPSKKVYTCDKAGCNKEYTSLLSFRKHLALHAAEEGSLECQICFDVFETKEEILHHLKIHAGSRTVKNPSEKKFTCEYCDRKFFTKKDVRRHLVVHTGMRDFLCQFCPQRFGRKDHLVRHIKKSHSKQLPPESAAAAGAATAQQQQPPKPEAVEMVVVKTEYSETIVKVETTSESSVSNPEHFNPLEFNIETFSETDLIFAQPISSDQLQYLPSTSTQPPPATFLGELGEATPDLAVPPNPEDISPQLLEETVLIQDSEIIRLLESSEDKNLPLPGFSQTFQSPPPPP